MITGQVIKTLYGPTDMMIVQKDDGTVWSYYPASYLQVLAEQYDEYISKLRSECVNALDKVNNLNDTNDSLRRSNDNLIKQNKKLRAEVANLKSLLPTDS